MIDLRNKDLPDAVMVGGKSFALYTDYRVWLEFSERIKNPNCTLADLCFVFRDEVPEVPFLQELLEWFHNPNSTPRHIEGIGDDSDDVLVDYIQDGEYIFASFMYDYGLNLLKADLHWYEFKALLTSLSDKCKIRQIMTMRGYRKNDRKLEQQYEDMKRVWTLDVGEDEEAAALTEYYNSL